MFLRLLKWLGIGLGLLALVAFGAFQYFKSAAHARFDRVVEVELEDIPIPFPLSEDELAELRRERAATSGADAQAEGAADAAPAADPLAGVDLEALALERAIARGKRYLETRAGCMDCHGEDFAGKPIIDNPVMGTWVAPNITRGGVTKSYTGKDWVRILRHGLRQDGHPATMPSVDFTWFSDQEISDIAAYINSVPPSEKVNEPTTFGPVFALLLAQGEIPISADNIDHKAPRSKYPPALAANIELGKHLGTTCTGCHGPTLAGGPVKGGDPAWPPAANLTFHETGLAKWSLDDFRKALREGVRPDGSAVRPPMPIPYTARLSDIEIEALYIYFKSLPPAPIGQ